VRRSVPPAGYFKARAADGSPTYGELDVALALNYPALTPPTLTQSQRGADVTELIRHLGNTSLVSKVEQYVAEPDSNKDSLLAFGEFLTVFAQENQIETETDQGVT
jgi:hypothetical protein